MILDRAQKASVLQLCVSKRWLPQLEVDVESKVRTEKGKYLLTDIDVLVFVPQAISGFERVIFDCKSGRRESAINRSFWLRGLMDKIGADQGFIILNDKLNVNRDHRISASELRVSLIQENEFEIFSNSLGGSVKKLDAASAEIDLWEKFVIVNGRYAGLQSYLEFSKASYWMSRDPGEQCRKTVAKLRAIKDELDPKKDEHLALFADAICLFLLSLSQLTLKIFLSFLRPASQAEFSETLLSVIYGGYESLDTAQKFRRLGLNLGADESVSVFPEMERLELLAREMLQSPPQALSSALLAREICLGALASGSPTNFARTLAMEQPYSAKYCLLAAEYLCKACKLPRDFGAHFSDIFLSLLQVKSK